MDCVHLVDVFVMKIILNLIGQKFGLLTVIEYNGSNGTQSTWKCQCDCGNITIVSTSSLTQGKKKSCGCLSKYHAQMLGQCAKKYNTYEEHEDCYYGYNLVYPDKFFIIDKDDYELYILPYWGDPIGADSIYGFNREPLQSFSYETAVKNSKLAKKIADLLNGDYLYGAPDFSPYTITKDLIEQHMELSSQFDEIWSMVYMMQCLEMISVDEILDDEQGRVYFATSVGISL